jgi:hypothetical protein
LSARAFELPNNRPALIETDKMEAAARWYRRDTRRCLSDSLDLLRLPIERGQERSPPCRVIAFAFSRENPLGGNRDIDTHGEQAVDSLFFEKNSLIRIRKFPVRS